MVSARDLVKMWSQVSRVADHNEQPQVVDRLAEALKHFSRAEARKLVVGAKGVPILCSYSNDGTPMTVRKRVVLQGVAGRTHREGGASCELLCQRAMFRTRDRTTGGWQTAILLRDPVPLVHGKGADPVFSAAVEFVQTLRQMGHRGIAIQHYSFDRALHAPLVRRFKQKHAQLGPAWVAPTGPEAGALALFPPAVLEWVLDTPCCNHDVHNGLKWSLLQYLSDDLFMKDVFVVIESMRNAFSLLHEELSRWVLTVVSWREGEDLRDPAGALALWSALGCEPRWAEELVELGLEWTGEHLLVHERHRESEEVWSRVMNCVLFAMKLDRFSDSRWCTLGRSARQVVLGQLLGVDSLVHAVLADKSASDYHLGGYRKKSEKVTQFLCLAAFASVPADELLGDMMRDDRLVLHRDEYQGRLKSDFEWLQDLPPVVWDAVAGLCKDWSGGEMRSQALSSAHTTLGFVHERVWSALDQYPWKLACGDVDANLAALAALDAPPAQESVTRKMWALASSEFDFPLEQLREAVGLLGHISWSSATVEQQHASATQVKHRHHTYGTNTLCTRALIHTARLFFAVRPEDKAIARLQERLRAHLEKQPCKLRGHNIFYREAVKTMKHKQIAGVSYRSATQQETQGWMAAAQKRWSSLPDSSSMVQRCQQAARVEGVRRDQERLAAMMKAAADVEEAVFKKKEKERSGLPPRMIFSECAFTADQIARLTELYHDSEIFAQKKVAQVRKAAVVHSMLSPVELARLDAQPAMQKEQDAKPWWLPTVATCRDGFANCAIRIGADSRSYYRFLFAKQQPQLAMFCPLHLEDRWVQPMPVAAGSEDVDCQKLVDWLYSFTCDRLDIKSASELDLSPDSSVFVLYGLVDLGERIVADGPEYDLASFVMGMKELDRLGRGGPSKKASRTAEQEAEWNAEVAAEPWLAVAKGSRPAKRSRTAASVASSSHEAGGGEEGVEAEDGGAIVPSADVMELTDDAIEDIFAKLEGMREAWTVRYGDAQQPDFGGGLLGGASTFKSSRVISDFVCCEATTAEAKAFVQRYHLHASKRASTSLYDGVHNATVLVSAWAHRMQFSFTCTASMAGRNTFLLLPTTIPTKSRRSSLSW